MKVKKRKIVLLIFYINVAIALSLFKVLGAVLPILEFDYFNRYVILVTSVLSCLIIFNGSKQISRTLFFEVTYIFLIFWLRILLDFIGGRNVYKEINAYSCYMYIIIAIPLFYVLQQKATSIDKLIDRLLGLSLISYGLRSLISIVYSATGKRIFESIQSESASKDWFRNNILRVNPPFIGMIIIALCVYRLTTANKHKWFYYFEIAVALTYSALVHCSRAALLYQIIELIFLIMYMKKSTLKQFILFFILAIGLVVLIQSGFLDVYISKLFNSNDALYWFSNQSRFFAYPYFFEIFLNNLWTGTGFLIEDERYFRNNLITGGLGDVGILWTTVQLGIAGVFIYIFLIVRTITTGLRLRNHGDANLSILVLGMGVSMILTSINVDLFYPVYVMSIPVIVSIVEYSRLHLIRRETRNS